MIVISVTALQAVPAASMSSLLPVCTRPGKSSPIGTVGLTGAASEHCPQCVDGRGVHESGDAGMATALPNTYTRRARLVPGLFALLPVAVDVLVAVPSAVEWWQKVVAVLVAAGLWILPAQLIADRGKSRQDGLYRAWGGAPTTVGLRWSAAENKVAMRQRHIDVSTATGIRLPDERAEAKDPLAADHAYEAAVAALREATRSKDAFPLVTEEVTNYGFRRNLYGARPAGITLAVLASAAAVAGVVLAARGHHVSLGWSIAALVINLIWLIGWLTIVNPNFVRPAADRYADRLLAAASQLPKKAR
jgi:hypothetical protein